MTKLERPALLILADPGARQAAYRLFAAFDRRGVPADVELASGAVSNRPLPGILCLLLSPGVSENLALSLRLDAFLKAHGQDRLILLRVGSVIAEAAIYPGVLRFERGGEDRLAKIEPPKPDAVLAGDGRDADEAVSRLLSQWPDLTAGDSPENAVGEDRPPQSNARARWGRAGWAAAAGFAALSIGLGVFALNLQSERSELLVARQEAERRADDWLLTLENDLSPDLRQAVFATLGEELMGELSAPDWSVLSSEELGTRAGLLHTVGDAWLRQGRYAEAEQAFEIAHAVTGELLSRDPGHADRMFDHAQSAFWLGNAAFLQRRLVPAEAAFGTYAELSERLYERDPTNPVYQAERAYALTNTGTVALERGDVFTARQNFSEVIAARETALLEAGAATRRDLSNAYAWRAEAERALGDLDAAIADRRRSLTLSEEHLAENPAQTIRRYWVGTAERALASVLVDAGRIEDAQSQLELARATFEAVLEAAPDSADVRRHYMATMRDLAELSLFDGELVRAQLLIDGARRYRIEGDAGPSEDEREFEHAAIDLLAARIALVRGAYDDALANAVSALAAMERHASEGRVFRRHYAAEARFYEGEALTALGRQSEAERAWRAGLAHLSELPEARDLRARALEAMLLARLGETVRAEAVRQAVIVAGYARPDFIAFWSAEPESGLAALSQANEADENGG